MRRCFRFSLFFCAFLVSCHRNHNAPTSAHPLTRFTWHSPDRIFLAGDFNQWSPTANAMHRENSDRWTVDLPLAPGRYQYKFVVDGEWFQDRANPASAPDGWGGSNSVITVGETGTGLARPTPSGSETSAPPL